MESLIAPRAPSTAAPPAIGGRFRVVDVLGRGRGVETLLCDDLQTGGRAVLKVTPRSTVATSVRARLEHEATVLGTMRGPPPSPSSSPAQPTVPLLELGEDEDLLYLARPFVPGASLAERLAHGPLPVRPALALGRDLLAALEALHDHGIVHRDVKPANIIVREEGDGSGKAAGTGFRATLIDLGLSRSDRLDRSLRDEPVGTALYASPEQAGLLDHPVDERSDLYSAGVVLFEAVAGRPPFVGRTVGEVLRQHLSARPPELRGLGLTVPRALDEVLSRLLRKDPRDRYRSAGAAARDLSEIDAALERGVAEPAIIVGAHDRRGTLAEPAFVGRASELAALDRAVERVRRGEGGLVLLSAESGGGKTRLLDELARRTAHAGAWVLRGQGVDQAGRRPFQVLAGVAGDLIAAASADPEVAEAVRRRTGDAAEAACNALPELSEVLAARADTVLGPEAHGELRSLQGLSALLDALGSEARPAVVLLDDCQWADEPTLKLLGRWLRRPEAADPLAAGDEGGRRARHVMVVVAFRSEEVPPGHPLRRLDRATLLDLPPFAPEDVRSLVESMAGPLPADVVDTVARLSEGSPFMATAVLRGLVESGALVALPDGWRVEALAMADMQSSRRAAAFLARRLGLLPPTTLRLVSVGAVLGKEFPLDLAAFLAGEAPSRAVSALDGARRRHVLWLDAREGRYAFVHDKLRETALELIPAAARRDLHRRAAEELERTAPGRVFDLAFHFDSAGEPARALPYAIAAAERARAQHVLELAERLYRIAARGAAPTDDGVRGRIAEGLGDVLMLRGRYDEATVELERALGLARGNVARAQIEGKRGELAFKRGDVKTASLALERALRTLGRFSPQRFTTFLLLLLFELVVQALHTLCPRLFLARRPLEGAEEELVAIRLYSRLAYAYWFQRGKVPCAWAHIREMNLAERYPPTPELAQAYSEHAPVMTMVPWFGRGIVYAERSLALRRGFGDIWGQGQSLHFYGVVLYAASRFRECIEKCREALRLLERTGDRWEVNTAGWHVALCLYRLGDLRAAVDAGRRTHRAGLEIGDHQASGISLGAWAKASSGRVPKAVVEAERARGTEDRHTMAEVAMAEATRLLAEGRPHEAAGVLEEAQRLVDAAGMQQEYVAPIPAWHATALREELECTPAYATARRRALAAKLRRVVRRAVRVARLYPNNGPHALREAALFEALRGRGRRARALLDASLADAERKEMRGERARTLLARGLLGAHQGWPDAARDERAGHEELRAIEPAEAGEGDDLTPAAGPAEATLSLVDRFDAVLEVGRRIATALTPEAVFAAVREAALTLLRGERCAVLEVEEEDAPRLRLVLPVASEASPGYSATLAGRALAAGRPLVFAEGADEPGESVLLSGVRSAICAPIFLRGRPAACFYVTHGQVGGLFGREEEALAEFVATLASAALENAEGFAERRRAEETIRASLREKEALLREIHHRVKNNLQVVSSLLNLHAEHSKGRDPAEVARECRRRIRSMALVHERLYRSKDLARIELGGYVRDLAGNLFRSYGPEAAAAIELRLEADEISLGIDAAIPCGLILNELISNALKHAFPGGRRGLVRVGIRARKDGGLALTVEDDGVGFAAPRAPGAETLGLTLVGALAGQLGGAATFAAGERGGARVEVVVATAGGTA